MTTTLDKPMYCLLFAAAAALASCAAEEPPAVPADITLTAAFTPLGSATLYNLDGTPVLSASGDGTVRLSVPRGTYYLDFTDDLGNTMFSTAIAPRFAARAEGAALVVTPHEVEGIDHTLAMLIVGDGNHTGDGGGVSTSTYAITSDEMSKRWRVVWEEQRAMVGPNFVGPYYWSDQGEVYGRYYYLSEDLGAYNAVVSAYGQYASCKNSIAPYSPCALTQGSGCGRGRG